MQKNIRIKAGKQIRRLEKINKLIESADQFEKNEIKIFEWESGLG